MSSSTATTAVEIWIREAVQQVLFQWNNNHNDDNHHDAADDVTDAVDTLCKNLYQQGITKVEHLFYIDTVQLWQNLGPNVPLGIYCEIHYRLIPLRQQQQQQHCIDNNGTKQQQHHHQRSVSLGLSPPTTTTTLERVGEDGDRTATATTSNTTNNKSQNKKNTDDDKGTMSFFMSIRTLSKVTTPLDWIFPFDHQTAFKRGVIHGLDNNALMRSAISVSELWIIFLTLLMGVCVELWISYPEFENSNDEGDNSQMGIIGLVYNIVGYFTMCCCYMGLTLFAVFFVVSLSIDKDKFKTYYMLILNNVEVGEILLISAWYGFLVLSSLYLFASNASMIQKYDLPDTKSNIVFSVVPIAIAFIFCYFTIYNLNCLGRIPFHCGLMSSEQNNNSNSPSSPPCCNDDDHVKFATTTTTTAAQVEYRQVQKALDDLIESPQDVLDSMCNGTTTNTGSFIVKSSKQKSSDSKRLRKRFFCPAGAAAAT